MTSISGVQTSGYVDQFTIMAKRGMQVATALAIPILLSLGSALGFPSCSYP